VDAWFEGQKKLYVGAGRAFGDLVRDNNGDVGVSKVCCS